MALRSESLIIHQIYWDILFIKSRASVRERETAQSFKAMPKRWESSPKDSWVGALQQSNICYLSLCLYGLSHGGQGWKECNEQCAYCTSIVCTYLYVYVWLPPKDMFLQSTYLYVKSKMWNALRRYSRQANVKHFFLSKASVQHLKLYSLSTITLTSVKVGSPSVLF